jgi:hypothetical protein
MMNKELALQTMMLLSALESWGFATKERIPDYLLEDIEKVQDQLRGIVLDQPAPVHYLIDGKIVGGF